MSVENALDKINRFHQDDEERNKKKAEYFDKIAKMFYEQNFGAANKSEIELLMFSIFLDEMIEHNCDDKNVLDYKECSDFKLGKMLGIPQEKVKTLKVKKQARYPKEFEWQKSFLSIKDAIRYDLEKKRIIIPVTDPNLYLSIRNFIEENNGYIEIQRGSNILQMRPEHFFSLLYLGISNDAEKKKAKKAFIKKLKKINEIEDIDEINTDDEIIGRILNIGDDVLELFEDVVLELNNPLLLIIKSIRKIGKLAIKKGKE